MYYTNYICYTYYTDYIFFRCVWNSVSRITSGRTNAQPLPRLLMSWVIISSLLYALGGWRTTARHIQMDRLQDETLWGDYTFFLKNFDFLKKSEKFSENPKIFRTFRNIFGKSEIFSDFPKKIRKVPKFLGKSE